MATLPPPRLVTTAHTADGKSMISSDTTLTPFQPFGPSATAFTVFHTSDVVPASNQGEYTAARTNSIPRPSPSGTVFCTSDFPPHYSAPMHRTLSLDYCIVLSGSIWMTMDLGDETEVKAGEFILQRGTNHLWSNRNDVPCRILFVMVGSEMLKLEDGTELEATKMGAPPKK